MISRNFASTIVLLLLTACAAAPEPAAPDADPRASDADQRFSTPDAELNYRLLIGEIALSRGELDDAVSEYLRAMQLSDDPGIAERAVQLALHLGLTDDAARAAQRWRALEPDASGPLEVEVVTALRVGELRTAAARAETLLGIWGAPDEEAYQSLGRLLIEEPDHAAAVALMQRITARHDVTAAWQVLGMLALRADDVTTATDAARRARVLDPESTRAAMLEARVLALSGDMERGLALMRATLAERPDDPTLRFALAGLYLAAGQNTEALHELEQVVATVPSYMDARWTLAVLLTQMGELDGAEEQFLALLADPVRRWDIPYYLGGIEEQRGDWEGALEWFDQVEWGDQLLNARMKAAHMLMELGEHDEARARFDHLHADFADDRARLYRVEAELLARTADPEAALAAYDRALAEMPDDAGLLFGRALQRERLGQYEEAIADLRRVHAQRPDSAEAQNALGYVLADVGPPESWPEARALIAQAVEQEPDNASFLDSMGWVLYRLGDLDGAREWLERAWRQYSDPEIGAHLGEVMWQQRDREAAHAIWGAAARIDAEHPVLVETLERFGIETSPPDE